MIDGFAPVKMTAWTVKHHASGGYENLMGLAVCRRQKCQIEECEARTDEMRRFGSWVKNLSFGGTLGLVFGLRGLPNRSNVSLIV